MFAEAFNHAFSVASLSSLSSWMLIGFGMVIMYLIVTAARTNAADGWLVRRRLAWIPIGIIVILAVIFLYSHVSIDWQWH